MLPGARVVDLTHTILPNIPNWDGGCGFENKILFDYNPDVGQNETTFLVHEIKMCAGIGTHVDAPSHCCPGGRHIADIPLQELISPCAVIDVSSNVTDCSYVVSKLDIEEFESTYGQIETGTFVIFKTGWDKYWKEDPLKYRNNLVFPSISQAVAEYLVDLNISGIGIDTLSPDCDGSQFPVHRIILGSGKFIVENLTNLSTIPAVGSTIMVMPLKLEGCTEAPARVFCIL